MDSTKIKQEKKDNTFSGESFISAAINGDLATIKQLLSQGHSPDQVDDNSITALMHAVANGHILVAKALIDAEAFLNKSDYLRKGQTPLMVSIVKKNPQMTNLLLDAGASVTVTDNEGNSPLLYAVRSQSLDLVKCLVEEWRANIQHQNNNKQTALMIAAYHGFANIAQYLIERKSNVNEKNKLGFTALMYAVFSRNENLVEYFGALEYIEINSQDRKGNSALMTAVFFQNVNIVIKLLKAGAIVNVKNVLAQTPLMVAAIMGLDDIVNVLLKAGANKELKSASGQTALDYAVNNKCDKVIPLLTEYVHGYKPVVFRSIQEKNSSDKKTIINQNRNNHFFIKKYIL